MPHLRNGATLKLDMFMNTLTLSLIATFAYNTAIAGLLTATGWMAESCGFGCNFVFSQSIGFSIAIISSLTLAKMPVGRLRWAALAVGLTLGFALTGVGGWSHPLIWQAMLIGLFFGLLASITFVLVERIGLLSKAVQIRELQGVEQDKRAMEANLKLLQAQIEPHFLFNTLANVNSLIDSDPVAASQLLERLNEWLRVALAQARSSHATLGDELAMLDNFCTSSKRALASGCAGKWIVRLTCALCRFRRCCCNRCWKMRCVMVSNQNWAVARFMCISPASKMRCICW